MTAKPGRQIYLIRHGETEWSLSGRHTGRTDIGLTAQGEQQARALQPWLSAIPFTDVFCSPRQRAQHTCDLAGLGAHAQVEPDLVEWDYGAYEGRRSPDIHQTRPGWSVFRDGCPDGEMPDQVTTRASRVIARLHHAGNTIALFTHGEFARALAASWIGLPVAAGEHFLLDTGALSILGYHPAHPEMPVITLWNAVPAFFAHPA